MKHEVTDSAQTEAFASVLEKSLDAMHALISVEALNSLVDEKTESGVSCYELPMGQFAIALGAGDELPPLVAQMAGFEKAANGRWFLGNHANARLLEVPQSLLEKYLKSLAEYI